jgi:poly(3-hydroxybutyrate) depolymerase
MFKKMSVCLLGMAILCANAQTVNLQGVISNSGGKPIANAIVSLVRQKMTDTTGTDGKYAFIGTSVRKLPNIVPQTSDISLKNNVLQFALSTASPMKVEIFNLKGNLLRQEINMNAAAGTYRFDISKNCQTANVLVIKAAIGRSEISFKYMPLNGRQYASSFSNAVSTNSNSGGLAKMAAVVDTLTVTATGFQTKSVAISSLDNQQQNITLDSARDDYHYYNNPPGPSTGCGKTLGSINKSGSYTISSAGGRGTYIIDIPKDYNKDKPYRLIFGMHCMGGSAARVAAADNGDDLSAFYSLKTLADKDNIQCIYVAPQGDGGGTWSPANDPIFFSDILKTVKGNLCIDTTRVFCAGFSFGAMFSYALSLAYPKQLRAVACYAPANWNFDPQPTNNHIPLAYYQTTGTGDGLCAWINNDANKKGGKYCLLQHAEDNGCNTNITIKLATSGTHVVTEFTGCKDGYPVKFSSFNGGHQCMASDPGSNVNWIEVETWEFFKRF